jgi:hypothetical protein
MDTSPHDAGVATPAKRGWRRHSEEFKSRVIELAREGHGSVAAIALANGLNANMLRRWVREAELADTPPAAVREQTLLKPAVFVPVTLAGRIPQGHTHYGIKPPADQPAVSRVTDLQATRSWAWIQQGAMTAAGHSGASHFCCSPH